MANYEPIPETPPPPPPNEGPPAGGLLQINITTISTIFLIFGIIYCIAFVNDIQKDKFENIDIAANNENMILKNILIAQNESKYKLMYILDKSRYIERISDEKIKDIIYKWKKDNLAYLGIKRFSIPMISTINTGKSSTLNFILNTNYLEVRENVTTKCCVIIRDRKGYKKGKIYNVIIEKRADIDKYNFEKGDEIKQDIKSFIEERNRKIEQLQDVNMEIKDASLYFVIMELDTGLFEGEYEKYSELVEFIDIPGLDENGVKNNFYFKNVLPFIKMNFLFPVILLDSTRFQSVDVFATFHEIFQPYISPYIKENFFNRIVENDLKNQNYTLNKIKEEALFLINKLNLHKANERNKIMNEMIEETSNEFEVDLKFGKNCFVINARAKNIEVNKYMSLIDYTNYTLNKKDYDENEEILDLLTEAFKNDFNFIIPDNIEEISKKSKKSKGYQQFKKLVEESNIMQRDFQESYYYYFNEIFNLKKITTKKMDEDGDIIKTAIKSKIKILIDKFLDDNDFKKILEYTNIKEEDLNEDFSKYIKIDDPFNFIQILQSPIKELKTINNSGILQLNDDFDELYKFINKNKFINYIVIGEYSSGKSFTLNNIIGYNLYLLTGGQEETTSHAFIIRNSKLINLYEADLVKNQFGYYFNKKTKLASGKEKVAEKIEELNRNKKEFSYYILETPIQMFENITLPQEIINSIELIDYPGLQTKKAEKLNLINTPLINKDLIDGFFFVALPTNNKMNSLNKIFKTTINKFLYQDSNYEDSMNCFFLYTKNTKEDKTDFNKFDVNKQVLKLFEELKKEMDMSDVEKVKKKFDSTLFMNFAKFSNFDYYTHITFVEKLKSFENFLSDIIPNNIKKVRKKNFGNLFKNIDYYINEQYEKNIEKGFIKSISELLPWSNKEKDNIINNNDIELFANLFRDILIKLNFIEDDYIFGDYELSEIKKYLDKYFYFKKNLSYEKYKNSFYEEFKAKVIHFMGTSKDIMYRYLNVYLNDIITKLKGVIKTIRDKIHLNPEEFKKKYSLEIKKQIIDEIEEKYNYSLQNINESLIKMEKENLYLKNILNCNEYSNNFEENFKEMKKRIDEQIEYSSKLCNIYYNFFSISIDKIIQNYEDNKYKFLYEKNYIDSKANIDINIFFKNEEENANLFSTVYKRILGQYLNYFTYFLGIYNKFTEEIKNQCENYYKILNSSHNVFENILIESMDELKHKTIKYIELIFNTAQSNFNESKRNLEILNNVEKFLKNILKNNKVN